MKVIITEPLNICVKVSSKCLSELYEVMTERIGKTKIVVQLVHGPQSPIEVIHEYDSVDELLDNRAILLEWISEISLQAESEDKSQKASVRFLRGILPSALTLMLKGRFSQRIEVTIESSNPRVLSDRLIEICQLYRRPLVYSMFFKAQEFMQMLCLYSSIGVIAGKIIEIMFYEIISSDSSVTTSATYVMLGSNIIIISCLGIVEAVFPLVEFDLKNARPQPSKNKKSETPKAV